MKTSPPREKQQNALNLAFTRKNNQNSSVQVYKSSRRQDLIDSMIKKRELKTIIPGVLTVSTYDKFPPLAYEVPTGKRDGKGEEIMRWEGLDVDFIREFARFIGYKVNFVKETVFKGIWDKPRKGESDLAISGIANSFGPEGRRGGNETEWTLPYFYVNRSVIKRKTTPFPGSHLRIAATEGSTGWDDGIARGVTAMGTLVKAEGDKLNFPKLYDNKIEAIMHGDDVSRALLRENIAKYSKEHPEDPSLKGYPLTMVSWEMVPTLLPKDGEIFAYPTKAGSGVAVVLSAFIIRSIQNGFLESLVHKYHMDLDHFVDERKIPTGEYLPSGNLLQDDRLLSAKLFRFITSAHRIPPFVNMINSSLQTLYSNDKISFRFAPQFNNLSVCDPYLLNFYIVSLFEQKGDNNTNLAYAINGDPLDNNPPKEVEQLRSNEFSNITIKFGSLREGNAFRYNPQRRMLTIDCSVFIKQIRSKLEAVSTLQEKIQIYSAEASLLAKQCVADVLYHELMRNLSKETLKEIMPEKTVKSSEETVKSPEETVESLWSQFSGNNIRLFIKKEDIFQKLFVDGQIMLNKQTKEEEEAAEKKAVQNKKNNFRKNLSDVLEEKQQKIKGARTKYLSAPFTNELLGIPKTSQNLGKNSLSRLRPTSVAYTSRSSAIGNNNSNPNFSRKEFTNRKKIKEGKYKTTILTNKTLKQKPNVNTRYKPKQYSLFSPTSYDNNIFSL